MITEQGLSELRQVVSAAETANAAMSVIQSLGGSIAGGKDDPAARTSAILLLESAIEKLRKAEA